MTLDLDSIRLRLALILDYLSEIEPLASMGRDEFLSNRYMQRAAERLLEITVQAAIDTNNHLLKEQFGLAISSNAIGFQELSRYAVISEELANQLADSGRLRNRLAHRYYEIDYEILFAILSKVLEHYPQYAQQIENFISSLETNHDAES
jgi:uncharacterized protein YutE (UPF0331/DUF86 family)